VPKAYDGLKAYNGTDDTLHKWRNGGNGGVEFRGRSRRSLTFHSYHIFLRNVVHRLGSWYVPGIRKANESVYEMSNAAAAIPLWESTMHDDLGLWTTVWVLFGTSFVGALIVASAIGLLQ
jgi:hypothetical protein